MTIIKGLFKLGVKLVLNSSLLLAIRYHNVDMLEDLVKHSTPIHTTRSRERVISNSDDEYFDPGFQGRDDEEDGCTNLVELATFERDQ